jgi:hypothetical protein
VVGSLWSDLCGRPGRGDHQLVDVESQAAPLGLESAREAAAAARSCRGAASLAPGRRRRVRLPDRRGGARRRRRRGRRSQANHEPRRLAGQELRRRRGEQRDQARMGDERRGRARAGVQVDPSDLHEAYRDLDGPDGLPPLGFEQRPEGGDALEGRGGRRTVRDASREPIASTGYVAAIGPGRPGA